MWRSHSVFRQRQRLSFSLSRTLVPCTGRSLTRRQYRLCRDCETVPHPGQTALLFPSASTIQPFSDEIIFCHVNSARPGHNSGNDHFFSIHSHGFRRSRECCTKIEPEPKDVHLFKQKWFGAQGLAEDVRSYGQWIREEANKRIGHLYPGVNITLNMVGGRPDLEPYVGKTL